MQNLWLHGPEHYLTEVCILSLIQTSFIYSVLGRHNEYVCGLEDS